MAKLYKNILTSFKFCIEKVINMIIKLLSPKNFKKIIFALFCIIFFVILQDKIISFIEKYILVSPNFSNVVLDIVLVFVSLLVILYLLIKIIKDKYRPSYNEIFISVAIYSIIAYYYQIAKWRILDLELYFFKFPYIFLILIPILIFLILPIIVRHYNKKQVAIKNHYLGDDPIFKIEDDRLDSKKVGEKLLAILKNEKHDCSFTIGLVGPWGNGKSSVINFVQNNLKEKNETIVIHFLPYLNHTENDIINEFFILLSNELGKYSGKVANQIMLYSKKLTNLYKDKNIFNFIEDQINKFSSTPANKLYGEINTEISNIDKKIIVLVDDLDRLNEKEILQVLKLIRNTANFKNTIFVIAMDKEYVLNRLKNNNDILNSNFIDKFFQLEVYLPEIDNSLLRNYFIECLEKSLLSSDIGFRSELNDAMLNNENLFNDYIKNIRDVKRVVNQLIYDYPIFKKEINLKDFINFTYFKLKFPKYLKLLNDNKADFIEIDNDKNTYNLIKKTDDSKNKSSFTFDLYQRKAMFDNNILKKYKIYQDETITNSVDLDKSLNHEDKILLIKTLAYLFGTQNSTNDDTSIRSVNNFQMLMQQRIFKEFLTLHEYELLFDDLDLKLLLSNFNSENKIPQLINRLSFFNKVTPVTIEKGILILVNLYNQRINYKLNESELLLLINNFVEKHIASDELIPNDKIVFSDWLKKNVFENKNLSIETRLFLFGHLYKAKHHNNLWSLTEVYIEQQVLKLFKKYLEDASWIVNDFKVYGLYHSIKIINSKEIISIFKEYWNNDNIELLCAQTIEMDPFSINQFKISDFVTELFGNKNNFIDYIREFKSNTNKKLDEYLTFYNLSKITNHSIYILFHFVKSIIMIEKIDHNLKSPQYNKRNNSGEIGQIFFVTNSQILSTNLLDNLNRSNYDVRIYQNESQGIIEFYIELLILNKTITKEYIVTIAKRIIEISFEEAFWDPNQLDEILLFSNENFEPQSNSDNYVKLYSVQPPLK